MRAGAYGLSLVADPLDAGILRALERGPLPLIDLRRAVGSPPETTLRKHLRALDESGILTRTRQPDFPGPVTYELAPSGRELMHTILALSAWLAAAPTGPLRLGTPAAKSAIKALVDGWTTKILRALAARPLSLTELDRLLSGLNYPALERRLAALRLAGQIVPAPRRGGSTPYQVTRWLRSAVRPLAAAASWEHGHGPVGCEPPGRIDVEALFLLAIPLLELPSGLEGSCRFVVDISNSRGRARAGTVITLERGRAISFSSDLDAHATSSAIGSATAWLNVLSNRDGGDLDVDGDAELGEAVLGGLRRTAPSRDEPAAAA